ncbi:MAG: PHP domain-containing protein, partial [Promethearchaeota archaeon]
LHTHTVFSDGKNSIKQMVTQAVKLNLNHLAITDHFSDSWKSNVIPTLNSAEKIEDYFIKIENCQRYLKNNNKNLRLFKGIEIDIGSSERVIKKLIRPQDFDIILFEYLETPEGVAYVRNIIEYWKKLNPINNKFPILGLAHFDPSNFIYQGLDSLMYFLKEFKIYYEFNSSYYEYFSRKNELFFKKLKEHNIYVAIGSDAHNSNGLDFIEEPLKMIEIYKLEKNFKLFLKRLKNR